MDGKTNAQGPHMSNTLKIHVTMEPADVVTLCGRTTRGRRARHISQYPFDDCCNGCTSIISLCYTEDPFSRTCVQCGRSKSVSGFYVHVISAGGFHKRCIECTNSQPKRNKDASSKICPACGIDKPRGAYNTSKKSSDGLSSHCKDCHRESMKYRTSPEFLSKPKTEVLTKICTKCGLEKSSSEFVMNKREKDGLTSICKSCNNIYHQQLNRAYAEREHVDTPDIKQCYRCGGTKNAEEFNKDRTRPDGLAYICKECKSSERTELYQAHRERNEIVHPETKRCPKCGDELSSYCFYVNRGMSDGLSIWCKQCHNEDVRTRELANPERQKQRDHRRRALKLDLMGDVTPEKMREICNAERCYYCGVAFDEHNKPTIDHYVPLFLRGLHDDSNFVPACGSCNSSKGHKHPDDFSPRILA